MSFKLIVIYFSLILILLKVDFILFIHFIPKIFFELVKVIHCKRCFILGFWAYFKNFQILTLFRIKDKTSDFLLIGKFRERWKCYINNELFYSNEHFIQVSLFFLVKTFFTTFLSFGFHWFGPFVNKAFVRLLLILFLLKL